MELYKLRRRRYTTITMSILLALLALAVLIIGLYAFSQAQEPLSSFAGQVCGPDPKGGFTCTTPHYSQAQLEQMKQAAEQSLARTLGLPDSLTLIFQILGSVGVLALFVLSPITGTEYTQGTIRLLFTRGPTRLQCMLGKLLASLITCAVVLLLFSATYVILGMLLYPLTGQPYSYAFGLFNDANFGNTLGNTLLIGLIALGYWFSYAMLAFFFGTWGRATAAAIGCSLGWYILQGILNAVDAILQAIVPTGTLHDILAAFPDYLLDNNFGALINNRLQAISPTAASPAGISDLHALLVVAGYLLLTIGGAMLIAWRRDVTQ
jgi:ABC-type transport system involved in multi-copper enzyme maturation permease subunit